MNTNVNIESLAMELNGIMRNLFLVGNQFGDKNANCTWDNETIAETLNGIAYHIGRISDDLTAVSLQK